MKNFDLESKIKAIRVPEPGPEFWQALPGRVITRARGALSEERRRSLSSTASTARNHQSFILALAKFALVCLVTGFCLWQTGVPQIISRTWTKHEKALRQSLTQVPEHLEALMYDEHGLHYLVQDPP